ncbi:hypothetical protein [Chroococcidiopsis sp [FACHB-1243]]|nr:hypothetical protein [Chroococcidiopsis sp. [FACHB-1243]]
MPKAKAVNGIDVAIATVKTPWKALQHCSPDMGYSDRKSTL